MSPLERSMKVLRTSGYTVAKTEHWNPFAKIRQDLFGIFDLLCFRKDENGVAGVQVTTGDKHADHAAKIKASPIYQDWKAAGNSIYLHSWSKRGERGKRKIWTLRLE